MRGALGRLGEPPRVFPGGSRETNGEESERREENGRAVGEKGTRSNYLNGVVDSGELYRFARRRPYAARDAPTIIPAIASVTRDRALLRLFLLITHGAGVRLRSRLVYTCIRDNFDLGVWFGSELGNEIIKEMYDTSFWQ